MAIGTGKSGMFSQINVTPLTDVFLVLLVIMILVMPLADRTVLKVNPPQIGHRSTDPAIQRSVINVHVANDGVVTVGETRVAPADSLCIQRAIVAERARLKQDRVELVVQSERDALQKHVVAVMDAAVGAGIKSVSFI